MEWPLLGGEQDDARDWAVAEVGSARGRRVTFSPSMLPLFTRDSISSERRSADSRSTWIILQTRHLGLQLVLLLLLTQEITDMAPPSGRSISLNILKM